MQRRNSKKLRGRGRKDSRPGQHYASMVKSDTDIQRFKLWRELPPPITPMPKGPSPGAIFTTRQLVFNSLTQHTSVTTGAGTGLYILQNTANPLLGQISFCLADLNQATTFSSLFDRYRIEKVHVRVTSRNNAGQLFNIASPNNAAPQLYMAIDRDDSAAPGSIQALTEYDNCMVMPANSCLDIVLTPSVVATIANSSSTATSSVIKRSDEEWLDIAATTIPHFGLKWGITPLQATTTSAWYFDLQMWYFVSFKNTR